MGGDKRKISSGSEISFSELKQLAEDGDAIAQNKLAFFGVMQPDNQMVRHHFQKTERLFEPQTFRNQSGCISVKGCDELGMDGTKGTTR